MKFSGHDKLVITGAMSCAEMMLEKTGNVEIVVTGGKRTLTQNSLSHEWYGQVAEHLGDHTPTEVRRISKLHIGVPMLRADDPEFCEAYDKAIRPLPYELKLEVMDFWPVTSRMSKEQMSKYLDQMQKFWWDRCQIILERKESH